MKRRIILFVLVFMVAFKFTSITSQVYSDSVQVDDFDLLCDINIISDSFKENTFSERHFDSNFKDKYSSDEFNYSEKEKKKGWLGRFVDWLSKRGDSQNTDGYAMFLIWTLRILTFIAIVYGVYVVISILMGKDGAWLFYQKSDKKALNYGITEENLNTNDFTNLFQEAKLAGDFRLAVRYRYLLLLQQLNTNGDIKYHVEKTNNDYSYEIKNKELSDLFTYVSYIYDYTWYGAFYISDHEFNRALSAFDKTAKMM